jgi:TolA-binding protein
MVEMRVLIVLALLSATSAVSTSQDDAKNRPVTKVINLLKDMQAQLEKEGEEDEEVYDKMVCWCESGDKEKTKAIADAEARIMQLQATIEEMAATSTRLSEEIATLEGESRRGRPASRRPAASAKRSWPSSILRRRSRSRASPP